MNRVGRRRLVLSALGVPSAVLACGARYGESTAPPPSDAPVDAQSGETTPDGGVETGPSLEGDAAADGGDGARPCDGIGAVTSGGHCYFRLPEQETQPEAKAACAAAGAHLITVNSPEEQAIVVAMGELAPNADLWIGMETQAVTTDKAKFFWITGEPVTVAYWQKGQPSAADDELCVAHDESTPGWADRACLHERYFGICERG